jgi:hypothetical protein
MVSAWRFPSFIPNADAHRYVCYRCTSPSECGQERSSDLLIESGRPQLLQATWRDQIQRRRHSGQTSTKILSYLLYDRRQRCSRASQLYVPKAPEPSSVSRLALSQIAGTRAKGRDDRVADF